MEWQLHWLEAEGDLGPWRERIAAEVEAARSAMERVLPPLRLDILVVRLAGATIPEIGMEGYAYRKGLFALTLDPENPNFRHCLDNGSLRRQVAHEAHHCGRMAVTGYGRTLGEALVSEGLAGRFVGHLFGSPPEPWECAVDDDAIRAHLPGAAALAAPNSDHEGWFFGAGGRRPRWLGYTLGYRMVGDWLAAVPTPDGATWVGVSAAVVLAAARNGVLAEAR
jgi:hypothetical protein